MLKIDSILHVLFHTCYRYSELAIDLHVRAAPQTTALRSDFWSKMSRFFLLKMVRNEVLSYGNDV